MIRRIRSRLSALLLAFAIASVAGGAVAHELDHQFHKHDLPCALYLYSGHLNGVAPTGITLPLMTTGSSAMLDVTSDVPVRPMQPYAVRAPPLFPSSPVV